MLGFPQKIPIILLPKLGHEIILSPPKKKRPKIFNLVGKIQKVQQNSLIKPVATRHLLKARCYKASFKSPLLEAPLKPIATRHLLKARCYTVVPKSPLLHSTSKAHCYTAPKARNYTAPLKPVATRQYFFKILQSSNTNLVPIL